MTDHTDLCKRLREWQKWPDCLEAADAIEAQDKQIIDIEGRWANKIVVYSDRAEKAEAQIAEAIRLYPQLAERITSSVPDPSFGNPRTP